MMVCTVISIQLISIINRSNSNNTIFLDIGHNLNKLILTR